MPIVFRDFHESTRIFHRRLRKYAMPQVEDVPGRSSLLQDFFGPGKDAFLWAKQHTRIQIALKNAFAGAAAGLGDRDSPVDTSHVSSRRGHRFEYRRASIHVKNTRNAAANCLEDFPGVWESELFVVAAVQFTRPRVEKLDNLDAGFDLKEQV